ncbi:hypothetical protein Tsubulata_028357 [Turnera subulata]|uniref:MRG domain-containing protein n=1 Tax=Turnera subulata TaxID=218843 RepID=A0A9Q0G2N7_9ROSI|nr:hypothetical protein Tsubulata_028357 [Turnera subulata]
MGNSDDDSATVSDGSSTPTDSDTATETDEERPHPYHSPAFVAGDKVLALNDRRWYSAKVIIAFALFLSSKISIPPQRCWKSNVHARDGAITFIIAWDEWVGGDHLMLETDENVRKAEENNQKEELASTSNVGRGLHSKQKNSSVVRGRKRKHESFSKDEDIEPLEKLVDLQMPQTLKKQLIDDCEFITHLGKLVSLPREPNVEDILKKYKQYKLRKDNLVSKSDEEIMQGLRCYFDKALPVILLYRSERQQYFEATRNVVPPSKVYGAEHLLRLFVKLPELLAYVNIEEETLSELLQKLLDFLKFLQKNQNVFFLSTYHVPEDAETSCSK